MIKCRWDFGEKRYEIAAPTRHQSWQLMIELGAVIAGDHARGMNDCKNGVPHVDQGRKYNKGYSDRYSIEQQRSARSER